MDNATFNALPTIDRVVIKYVNAVESISSLLTGESIKPIFIIGFGNRANTPLTFPDNITIEGKEYQAGGLEVEFVRNVEGGGDCTSDTITAIYTQNVIPLEE